jgi:hypothetical protein
MGEQTRETIVGLFSGPFTRAEIIKTAVSFSNCVYNPQRMLIETTSATISSETLSAFLIVHGMDVKSVLSLSAEPPEQWPEIVAREAGSMFPTQYFGTLDPTGAVVAIVLRCCARAIVNHGM